MSLLPKHYLSAACRQAHSRVIQTSMIFEVSRLGTGHEWKLSRFCCTKTCGIRVCGVNIAKESRILGHYGAKAEVSCDGSPQHSRNDVVRPEAFRNTSKTFQAGLMFFSSTVTFRTWTSQTVSIVEDRSFLRRTASQLSPALDRGSFEKCHPLEIKRIVIVAC